jgi:pyruvate/2-oxoglutarate dehydrogenase complex dihydrolipoamide dehydrogenase (E3) component
MTELQRRPFMSQPEHMMSSSSAAGKAASCSPGTSSDDDRILGFTMIGSEAGEVLAAVQTAMLAGLSYPKLRDAVTTRLTIAEGLGPLLSNVPPRSGQ